MSQDKLEFAPSKWRNSAAIRFRIWERDDCVEVDFPDSGEPLWAYLTREQAGKVVELLQRFLAMPMKATEGRRRERC